MKKIILIATSMILVVFNAFAYDKLLWCETEDNEIIHIRVYEATNYYDDENLVGDWREEVFYEGYLERYTFTKGDEILNDAAMATIRHYYGSFLNPELEGKAFLVYSSTLRNGHFLSILITEGLIYTAVKGVR